MESPICTKCQKMLGKEDIHFDEKVQDDEKINYDDAEGDTACENNMDNTPNIIECNNKPNIIINVEGRRYYTL